MVKVLYSQLNSGLLQLIQNGTVDTFADGGYKAVGTWLDHFQFSFPDVFLEQFYAMRRPWLSILSGASLILSTFTPQFYLFAVLAIALTIGVAHLSLNRSSIGPMSKWCAVYPLVREVDTSGSNGCFTLRYHVMFALVGYFLVVLMGLYQGKLLTQLLFYGVDKPINTFDDMAAERTRVRQAAYGQRHVDVLVLLRTNLPFRRARVQVRARMHTTIHTVPNSIYRIRTPSE